MNGTKMRHGAYILLVEDNPADSLLITRALSNGSAGTRVVVAKDGYEATKLLPPAGGTTSVPKPDLILLDLNMPRKDGRTLLAEIKSNPSLRCIPVVVLTSSEADTDVNSAYSHHANSYFSKPMDLKEFYDVLDRIKQYWLADVKLPTQCVC